MNKQGHDKIKKHEEENELLRIKIAYLENLRPELRERINYKPRQSGSNHYAMARIEL